MRSKSGGTALYQAVMAAGREVTSPDRAAEVRGRLAIASQYVLRYAPSGLGVMAGHGKPLLIALLW